MTLLGRLRFALPCAMIVLVGATTPPAQTPPASAPKKSVDEETCVVSGLVIAKIEGTPLKGATIHLWSGEEREHTIAAKSDASGHFELKNVPAGQYHLSVAHNGYFESRYGQKKPGDPGATFTLRPGQTMNDLLFKLGHAGVITGRIFDEDGEVMPKVLVMALRAGYLNGRREFQPVTESESNDLGEFRLFGLAPGRYYVSAEDPSWSHIVGDREFTDGSKNSGEKTYTKVYYPNALDPGRASLLTVKEGEEVPAVDILMRQINVYRIRGKVLNQVSKQGTRSMQVEVFPRDQTAYWFGIGSQNLVKADGSFELPEIAPGEYTVHAKLFDEHRVYSTQQDVDVTTSDIEGLVLVIGQGSTIPGEVRWEGTPQVLRNDLRVYLESEQSMYGYGSAAPVDQSGQFTLKEVSDGTYRAAFTDLGKDCYIKEVHYGEALLPDVEFRVRGTGENLEIQVDCAGARLEGSVLNKDGLPATGAWVVVVPEESKRKFFRLFKSQLTDQYGHFEIHGLAPGKYKIFSWDDIERGSWEDPEFLKLYEDKGETVEVQDGDKKTVELNLIPPKDGDAKTD